MYIFKTIVFLSSQIGQSSLGLEDRSYYNRDSHVTVAYREFMRGIALALTNSTSMIDDDVKEIFEFEKHIAKVATFECKASGRTFVHVVPLDEK